MLVKLVVTLRNGTARKHECASDTVLTTLRQQFPDWQDCDVYTLHADKEALAVYDAVQLPVRQLHNCAV